MLFDEWEFLWQLKALFRLCFWQPNSWRELLVGLLCLLFLPLVILACALSNIEFYPARLPAAERNRRSGPGRHRRRSRSTPTRLSEQ